MKHSSCMISLASVAVIAACSTGGKGVAVQQATCSGGNKTTAQSLTNPLALTGPEQIYPGAGYLDFVFESGGVKKELRCTMHVEPESDDNSTVRL